MAQNRKPAATSNNGDWFGHFSTQAASYVGSRWAFAAAVGVVVVWAITGPIYRFSDPWQLVINTGTTIVTFLIVFLIQNTQNRDAKAIHLKLDELIRAIQTAQDQMIDIEKLSDQELDRLAAKYEKIRDECRNREKRELAAK